MMGLKAAVKHCAIVLAAFVSGGGAGMVLHTVVATTWYDLGSHRLIQRLIAAVIDDWAGINAAIVWLELPDCFVALCLGIAWGYLLPRWWLLTATSASVTLLLAPHVLVHLSRNFHPWLVFGFPSAIILFAACMPVPLLLFGAYSGARLRKLRAQLRSHGVAQGDCSPHEPATAD